MVVPAPGAELDESGLIEICRGRLAGYKVPKYLRSADDLPRNAAGKLLRREVRREAAKWSVDAASL